MQKSKSQVKIQNWPTKKILECIQKFPKKSGVPLKNYQKIGKFPIIDQGQDFIGGYTDDETLVYTNNLPVIVFGDHTRAIKFIDFPFAVGADGTKVLKPKDFFDSKFLYFALMSLNVESRGYARHFRILKELEIPLPPIGEQRKIVAKLEKVLGKIKEVKRLRAEAQKAAQNLLPAELHRIFTQHNTTHKQHTNKLENVGMSSNGKNGWEEKELGDETILKMTSGGTPSRANGDFYNGSIAWLKSGELEDNTNIIDSEEKISEDAIKQSSAKVFPKGTILFAMYGATAGKLGILSIDASTNQAVAGMIPVAEKLNNKFLYYFLLKQREKIISQA